MDLLKSTQSHLTEEFVASLVGKFVYVPRNEIKVYNIAEGKEERVNAWFGGAVVGYEKAYLVYDYYTKQDLDTPQLYYRVLLKDGMGYALADDAEIYGLTEEEFIELLAEHHKDEILEALIEDEIRKESKR